MMFSRQTTLVFSFSVARNSVNLSKNYYKILEVDSKCDHKVLKNSYLKLVKKLHPDVNPNGKEKFTEVQQAYEVLSDKETKTYYDQNNSCNHCNPNTAHKKQTHSAQSKTKQTNTGHEYYKHRTYASENPHDYFYKDTQQQQRTAKSQTKSQAKQNYDEDEQQDQQNKKSSNFDREQKRARSHASWEQFQKRKQHQEQRKYQHQTPQQKQMRDKLKAMRGFTSPYNVLWARHHIRYTDVMGSQEAQKKREEQIRSLMPQKVRKFYDKLMDKIQKLA